MRVLAVSLIVAIAGCTGTSGPVTPAPMVSIATYNVYLGADLIALFPPGQAVEQVSNNQFEEAVRQAFEAVVASQPAQRMDAIAAQIAAQPTDLVALQEVSLWQTQTPADGKTTPATEVRYDYLTLLIASLQQRGLAYDVALESRFTDVEVTGDFEPPMDVRLIDRDVILARAGGQVTITDPERHQYEIQLTAPSPQGSITAVRGWSAITANAAGRSARVINTHLEAAADPIRDAQAAELLLQTADIPSLAIVGDFNFDSGSAAYGSFTAAGFTDEWTVARPGDPGLTCCQDADLRNTTSKLSVRIDLLFARGPLQAVAAGLLGADPSARTASGLWPSDHAGVRFDFASQ